MKKQYFITLASILFFWGCSSSKSNTELPATISDQENVVTKELSENDETTELTQISGALNYSGSEPFAVPTIFVSDMLSYKLMGDETFINKTYPDISGSKATLYGNIIEKGSLIYFQVHYYTIITE